MNIFIITQFVLLIGFCFSSIFLKIIKIIYRLKGCLIITKDNFDNTPERYFSGFV